MKILIVNETFGFAGGLEQYLYSLNRELFRSGHHSSIVYSKNLGNSMDSFGQFFSNKYQIEFSHSQTSDIYAVREIIKKEQPDVAFLHKIPNPKLIRIIHQLLPTVRMIHDVEPFCPSARKYHYFSGKLCHRKMGIGCYLLPGCYRFTKSKIAFIALANLQRIQNEFRETCCLECIIVASHYMRNQLILNGCEDKRLTVLPLFVEGVATSVRNDRENRNIILFIGNINRGKGLDLLLKSLRYVTVPFRLVIIGNGKEIDNNRKLAAKLGLTYQIKFTDWMSHSEIETYYQQTALLVMPSRLPEPFGLVGLEAMAHAVPVLAFNVGGIPDWLEDGKNGFLIERGNIQQLAEKIELLLTDKNLNRRLGDYGRQCVMTKYNADDYVKKLLNIFEQAIKSRYGS